MEKIRVGFAMSTSWFDPPIVLTATVGVAFPAAVAGAVWAVREHGAAAAAGVCAGAVVAYKLYTSCGAANTEKHLTFIDEAFGRTWEGRRIPMDVLTNAYIEGKVDFKGDVLEALRVRDAYVSYRPTATTFSFLYQQFIPGLSSSLYDKGTVQRENALAYSKGNDFFEAFLGPSMVYTSGIHDGLDQTLEQAQENKMHEICRRLRLRPGMTMLDIGCGWGTLARFAEKHYGARVTAVTLSAEGAKYCRERNKAEGTNVEILEVEYRDIPRERKFDAISCIEMAEHVAPNHFNSYLKQVKGHLNPHGLFVMQVAGLRQGASWADVSWGLFMARYIFPGADSSFPLHIYISKLEHAGFQVNNVRGMQYTHTLEAWYRNFLRATDQSTASGKELCSKYPGEVIRLWTIFLAWSTLAAYEASAACRMITSHIDSPTYPREIFSDKLSSSSVVPMLR